GAPEEGHETAQRFGAVALLRAVRVGGDDELIVEGELPPGEELKALHHVERQVGTLEIEAQFDRSRDLVDILAAGTGRADEALAERVLGDRNGLSDADHLGNLARFAARESSGFAHRRM